MINTKQEAILIFVSFLLLIYCLVILAFVAVTLRRDFLEKKEREKLDDSKN